MEGAELAVPVLLAIGVLQGLFFLLPLAEPSSRLIGIALALTALLASRLLVDSPGRRLIVISVLFVAMFGNFIAHLLTSSPSFPFRISQLAILLGYVAVLLAGVISMAGAASFRRAIAALGTIAFLLLIAESLVEGPEDFSLAPGKVEWIGTTGKSDSGSAARFAPNTVVKTVYPANPRGYFFEPSDIAQRWRLLTFEGSEARFDTPDSGGVFGATILRAPGGIGWHIRIEEAPISLDRDERYELRFRARAQRPRTIAVAVAQAHAPYMGRGLGKEVRIDTTWRSFKETFRSTATDSDARLFFELGMDSASVKLANISLRAMSTNRVVEAPVSREMSVSYRINSQGCRGGEYTPQADTSTWRILVLGDGSTFGVGVHEGDTFSARLESALNGSAERTGAAPRYEVINCGGVGYSTRDAVQRYRSLGSHFRPNVVIVTVSPDDDRNAAELGDTATATSSGVDGLKWLSHLWGAARKIGTSPAAPPNFAVISSGIREIEASARQTGAQVAVALFNYRAPWAPLDSAISHDLRSTDIPLVDLGTVFRPFDEHDLLVLPGHDRHPNALAHRVAAQTVGKFLSAQGLLGVTPR